MTSFVGSIVTAAKYAIQGLAKAVKRERAFRQELMIFLPASLFALLLARSAGEMALLILPFVAILCLELMNSAVEKAVDRTGTQRDAFAEDAKDYAAAAVLLASAAAGIIWLVYLSLRFIVDPAP